MNTIETHKSGPHSFAPTFKSVQGVTDEGAPYSFARIHRNKHGRTNCVGVVLGFFAGSRSQRAVEKYAKFMNPEQSFGVFLSSKGLIDTVIERPDSYLVRTARPAKFEG